MNNSSAKIMPKGTILYTIFATIGEVGILDFDSACNQAIAGLNTYDKSINDYLYFLLVNLQVYMKSISKGCAQININQKILKETLVALPPLEEQKRIVDKINSFEPLLKAYDSYEKKLTELESTFAEKLKKSILQYAIEGKLVKQDPNDEPASVLLERIKAEKEKLIKEGKIKRDKNESYIYQGDDKNYYEKVGLNVSNINVPYHVPSSWLWAKIGTICNIVNGFTPLRSNSDFWNSKDCCWMTVEDINHQGKYLFETFQHISNLAIKSLDRIVPADSTFICCTSATIGKVAINKVPMASNQQFNGLTIKEYYPINNEYLFLFCSTLKTKLLEIAGITTFPFVSTGKLADILIPVPPLFEQNKIVAKLNIIIEKIDNLIY